jgi:putative oxidoreductase
MERLLSPWSSPLYALLRIVAGLLFACHGAQKLFGLFGGMGGQPGVAAPLFSLMGLAGVIEFVGGLCIAVGLWTSVFAFLASGEMAGAYFMAHAPRGFWPIQNGGELPVLFCFLFLYVAARGAGIWSLDQALHSVRLTRHPPAPVSAARP